MTAPDPIWLLQALARIAEALESIAMAVADLAEATRPAPGGQASSGPERGPPQPAAGPVTRHPGEGTAGGGRPCTVKARSEPESGTG
jgi:hypothetical protein